MRLQTRLTITFIGLAVIPLIMVGVTLTYRIFVDQRAQALQLEHEIARRVATEIGAFIQEREQEIRLLADIEQIQTQDDSEKNRILSILLLNQQIYEEFTLLDQSGAAQFSLSRLQFTSSNKLEDWTTRDEFTYVKTRGETYYSSVKFYELTGEPIMTIAVPLTNLKSGEFEGVLVADFRFKAVWELLENARVGEARMIYVVDAEHQVIAHQDPSIVLQGTQFQAPRQDGFYIGLSGTPVVLAVSHLQLGTQLFDVVAERPTSEALKLATTTVAIVIVVILIALLLAGGLSLLAARRIVRPIDELTVTAQRIRSGDLMQEVSVNSQDEIGVLANTFNLMTFQLRDLIQSLEQRTHELEAEISERQQAVEEREAYAAELERSNRELQEFAYVASHDLQEPLRKIQTFGDRLAQKYDGVLDPQGQDYLLRMQRAAKRMQILIIDLLDYSRVTTKAQPFKWVDLTAVIQSVITDLEAAIEAVNGQVHVMPLPTIQADKTQMRQLWQNLISNALKFHQDDLVPIVTITCVSLTDATCQIQIRDNGIGFDEKYISRIFNVFQRLHGREQYEGTGVGLAICKKIVDRHKGTINVISAPGKGSIFIVTLPVTQNS